MSGRTFRFVLVMAAATAATVASATSPPPPTDPPRPTGEIDGVVFDSTSGAPVFGATVTVVSTAGQDSALTDEAGRYTLVKLAPGEYSVRVSFGEAHVDRAHVTVEPGRPVNLSDHLDASPTLITVREKAEGPAPQPTRPAEPTFDSATRALPYSDEAWVKNVWGLAWLLLDIDATGRVVAVKFYKRPGYGLDDVAVREAFRLHFKPGLDSSGKPMSSKLMYPMEWESSQLKAGGLETARTMTHSKPCANSGRPMDMGSFHPMYRDCSPPDYAVGGREAWITAPGAPGARVVAQGGLPPATSEDDPVNACADGVGAACVNLGVRYGAGKDKTPVDPARAATLFDRACRLGEPIGCRLGALKESQPAAYTAALQRALDQDGCAERDGTRCYNVALTLQKKNPGHAAELYQGACEVGVALACNNLGLMYENGEGVLKDAHRASAFFERACAADEAIGCTNLGHLYMNGIDLRRDPPRARVALEKACAKSEAVGCYNLAILVEWGVGGQYDEARATELREKACKAGYDKACPERSRPK